MVIDELSLHSQAVPELNVTLVRTTGLPEHSGHAGSGGRVVDVVVEVVVVVVDVVVVALVVDVVVGLVVVDVVVVVVVDVVVVVVVAVVNEMSLP